MKTILAVVLVSMASVLLVTTGLSQGKITVNPVPVTNGVSGTLVDSTFMAGLYYGTQGATEDALVLGAVRGISGGYAAFSPSTPLPGSFAGASLSVQIRAWPSTYATYETAFATGNPSVLAGKSVVLNVTLASTTGPQFPAVLDFPGFTVYPVPEPGPALLSVLAAGLFWWRAGSQLRRQPQAAGQSLGRGCFCRPESSVALRQGAGLRP